MSETKKPMQAKRKSKGKRSTEKKLGNPMVFAENFGPIKSAQNVEIKPLTIFVGPSGQGKTYFSILLASLFRFMSDVSTRSQLIKEMYNDNPKNNDAIKSLKEEYDMCIKIGIAQLYENIIRNIGVASAKPLKRHRSRGDFKIGFDFDGWNFTADLNDGSYNLSLKKQNSQFMNNLDTWIKLGQRVGNPILLPDGRSGLTQTHQVIISTLLARATAAESLDMPTIRAVDAEFLKNNMRLVPEGERLYRNGAGYSVLANGEFEIIEDKAAIIKYLESVQRRIFGGVVKINADAPKQNRTMDLHTDSGLIMPVRVGASMLKELAPFFLQVQQLTNLGDTVIIEEPESHLHPAAQREIAKTIADLVTMGMKFVVTTHSPIVVEQIELEIEKSNIAEQSVAVYQFKKQKKPNGSMATKKATGSAATKIDYDKEDLYIIGDYESVFSDLHNELVEAIHYKDKKYRELPNIQKQI